MEVVRGLRRSLDAAPPQERATNRRLLRIAERVIEARIAELESAVCDTGRTQTKAKSEAQLLRLMLDEVKDLTRKRRKAS